MSNPYYKILDDYRELILICIDIRGISKYSCLSYQELAVGDLYLISSELAISAPDS